MPNGSSPSPYSTAILYSADYGKDKSGWCIPPGERVGRQPLPGHFYSPFHPPPPRTSLSFRPSKLVQVWYRHGHGVNRSPRWWPPICTYQVLDIRALVISRASDEDSGATLEHDVVPDTLGSALRIRIPADKAARYTPRASRPSVVTSDMPPLSSPTLSAPLLPLLDYCGLVFNLTNLVLGATRQLAALQPNH